MSCELAEFIGAIYGDGNLHIDKNRSYRLTISLHKDKDCVYAQYLCKQFKKLFGLTFTPYVYKNKSLLMLRCYSKKLVFFLNTEFNLPVGPKKRLGMPTKLQASQYALAFIRGLADTDGCVYTRTTSVYTYPVIKITNTNKALMQQVVEHLRIIGCNPVFSKRKSQEDHLQAYDAVLNGKKQCMLYEEFVGTSNPRNKLRGRRDSNPRSLGDSCHQPLT